MHLKYRLWNGGHFAQGGDELNVEQSLSHIINGA